MATDPFSALHNAAEVEDILSYRYQGKQNIPPIIILYTDGGQEHRSNFLSVKIALTVLQKSLNADMLVAVRTAPGHSFTHFVSGFIGTGYLLFGRNYLVIFILVSVLYVFSIFYSIF